MEYKKLSYNQIKQFTKLTTSMKKLTLTISLIIISALSLEAQPLFPGKENMHCYYGGENGKNYAAIFSTKNTSRQESILQCVEYLSKYDLVDNKDAVLASVKEYDDSQNEFTVPVDFRFGWHGSQYGDTLVAVGIHANWFAEPEAGLFSYDFRTPTGEQLYLDYNINNNPKAIINRSGAALEKSSWNSEMHHADRTLHAAIQIINQYNEANQSLKINTKTTMLEDYDQAVQLSLLLVEDHIVKPQKFSDHIDTFYVHNHVLRAGLPEHRPHP